MGTTPTYSWPYPESTDPVANGAQDIEDLALAVESTVSGIGGKIAQIVRATDTTSRTTTSTSMVDANISVTITPTSATSNILLIWSFRQNTENNGHPSTRSNYQITDSSNVAVSGAELALVGLLASTIRNWHHVTMIGYDSPATTSATTYKGRFSVQDGSQTAAIQNSDNTGQLFALEISA